MVNSRILIPIIGFGRAGGYRVLSQLASSWVDGGCVVDFLVHEALAEPYFPTKAGIRQITRDGAVARAPKDARAPAMASVPRGLEIYRSLLKGLREIGTEYDVILANHSLTTYPVFFAACGNAKKVYYIQAYEPEYFAIRPGIKNVALGWLSRFSYRLPLLQIANAAVYLNYREIRATSWVPPGIDRRVFYRRAEPPRFDPNKRWTIGSIGRTEPDKGTAVIQQAFAILAESDPCVHLKLAFSTADPNWRHERAEVVRPKDDAELAEFYRSVDVIVAVPTQQFGGFHYPVLEAMSCGTPVISTGHMPATAENAWLVTPNSAAAIVNALQRIREAAATRLIEMLDRAERSAAEYEWGTLAERFLRLMQGGT